MKMMVPIIRRGLDKDVLAKGEVVYDEEEGQITVTFEDETTRKEVETYLSTERAFKIPQSNRIDDYKILFAMPSENKMYFELSMSELYAKTGIWVNWANSNET